MKTLTREQLQVRKEQAERFVRNVLEDEGRADEIADEGLEEYAGRRKIAISNSRKKKNTMATSKTKAQLKREIHALRDQNDELQERLDHILNIAAPDDEDDEEDEEENEDIDGDE